MSRRGHAMVFPTARGLGAAGTLLAVFSIVGWLAAAGWEALWLGSGFSLFFLLVDGASVWLGRGLDFSMEVPAVVFPGQNTSFNLHIDLTGKKAGWLEFDIEAEGPHEPWPLFRVETRGEKTLHLSVDCRAFRRGEIVWHRLSCRKLSWFGLMAAEVSWPIGQKTSVIPPWPAIPRQAEQLFPKRELRVGLRPERFRGDGSELDHLREFDVGDDPRALDWHASARHRKLICRQNRAEQDNTIILAFDTGRLMGQPLLGIPRLEHALAGGLLIGYIAMAAGDRVGLQGFADRPGLFIEPQRGRRSFRRLGMGAAQLPYSDAETNHTGALLALGERLSRRSMIIVFTDFLDTISVELLLRHGGALARRHLVLFAVLADPDLGRIRRQIPETEQALFQAVVAARREAERRLVLERLQKLGIQVIEAAPEKMGPQLVGRYMESRRRELVG